MGLGTVEEKRSLYLSIAGGFIWDRKADRSHPNYAVQKYKFQEEEKERSGAQFKDLTGNIFGVEFRTHVQYGESLNVTVESGGDKYVLSISMKNKNAQDFMKALLLIDLTKSVNIKPYDFVDNDTKKRIQGTSFTQDGKKFSLWDLKLPKEFDKSDDKAFFAQSNAKARNRYFEDLSDYFMAEIEETVIPKLGKLNGVKESVEEATEEVAEATTEAKETVEEKPVAKVEAKMTPLKMKKFLVDYIKENYEGEELPKLNKEEIVAWYDLALATEELPFENDGSEEGADDEAALESELAELAG